MSSRAALHVLLDQIPDAALAVVAEDEAALEAGLASVAAGRLIPAEAVYAQLDAMLAEKRASPRGG